MNRVVLIVGIIILWQILSLLNFLPQNRLPSPISILMAFKEIISPGLPPGHSLTIHICYSLYRVCVGYLSALIIAIPLGLIMGWIKSFRIILEPIIGLIRHIPPLAWIPLSILWFGIGIKSAAFIIFLGAFFPILLSTLSGVLLIEEIYFDIAKIFNFSKFQIILKILIPASIPSIFTGMRIGMGIAWMTLIAAEFTGVKQGYGLGYMIMVARDIQRIDEVMAGMMVIGMIGLFWDFLFNFVKNKLFPWA